MAKLNLDLSEAGLEILTTADFEAQDAMSKTKKPAADQKAQTQQIKEPRCFYPARN